MTEDLLPIDVLAGGAGFVVHQDLRAGWTCSAAFLLTAGGLKLAEVTIRPSDAQPVPRSNDDTAEILAALEGLADARRSTTVTARMIHEDIDLARLYTDAGRWREHLLADPATGDALRALFRSEAESETGPAHPDDYRLAVFARDFVAVVQGGNRRNPRAVLAQDYGITSERCRDRLQRCRRRGLLTKADHGTVGGELTARALELLGGQAPADTTGDGDATWVRRSDDQRARARTRAAQKSTTTAGAVTRPGLKSSTTNARNPKAPTKSKKPKPR